MLKNYGQEKKRRGWKEQKEQADKGLYSEMFQYLQATSVEKLAYRKNPFWMILLIKSDSCSDKINLPNTSKMSVLLSCQEGYVNSLAYLFVSLTPFNSSRLLTGIFYFHFWQFSSPDFISLPSEEGHIDEIKTLSSDWDRLYQSVLPRHQRKI